ncbi:Lysophospholipid acyltransferase 5 [Fasciola gigantica]|uniref:Lysophospholipid acyltransferase 5 n=1 Tax=Fasciola gigantica TaxID=46835 RepID=A0A504YR11_FASGI|nr:Lysophospholipid acyltransferase 5 [Fasciola gigantica]
MGISGIILLSKLLSQFPADRMLTREFQHEWNIFSRFAFMAIFSQITLFRYVAIWLIGEGACVMLGLGCTGYVHVRPIAHHETRKESSSDLSAVEMRTKSILARRDSAIDWTQATGDLKTMTGDYDPTKVEILEAEHTACANISLANLLLATNTDNLVAGFNINTNKWMLEYVYKRLRFLGNKSLSQLITLFFLALWHGTYSGYYINFGLEFVTIAAEKDFLRIVKQSVYGPFLYTTTVGLVITSVIGKMHVVFLLTTPLVAFYLLQFRLWYPVLRSSYFIGFIYLLWPLAKPLAKKLFPRRSTSTDEKHASNGMSLGSFSDNDFKKTK